MGDSNPTRVRYEENRAAFSEVIGNPFAPKPIEGEYYRRKRRTSLKIFDAAAEGLGSRNAAKPNSSDFFADVENIVEEVLTNAINRERFWRTYLEDVPALNQDERNVVEQTMGRKFRLRHISPVTGYFRTIRRKVGENQSGSPTLKG